MKEKTEQQLLHDPYIEPRDGVIADALGATNAAYTEFIAELKNHEIEIDWRYCPDGKAWLGKALHRWTGSRGGQKEVTAFWLSIWDGFFKVTIYIPNKAHEDALSLPLNNDTKKMIENPQTMGKLKFFPVVFSLWSGELFGEVFTLVDFREKKRTGSRITKMVESLCKVEATGFALKMIKKAPANMRQQSLSTEKHDAKTKRRFISCQRLFGLYLTN